MRIVVIATIIMPRMQATAQAQNLREATAFLVRAVAIVVP
jgi:hypothetical protein